VSYSLVNVTTSDGYTAATTLNCPGAGTVTLSVRNAAVLVQFGAGSPPAWDNPEEFRAPQDRSTPRRAGRPCDAVRVRSAKPGTPAQVSIDAA
jgi:hypothetical protein